MKRTLLSPLAFALIVCLSSAPAFAKKPMLPKVGGGPAYSDEAFKPEGKKNWGRYSNPDQIGVAFDDDEKDSIRSYLRDEHHRKCPPGLAKKNVRCMPPGLSKKYMIGGLLPLKHQALPPELLVRLGPPPVGTFYAMVDRDVLIASEATKKILDAITLFSALE
jgi:hypothetical protein